MSKIIPDWKDQLKQSPIFNMSLSAKELFHSNFIAWVCETYPEQMGAFFASFLGLGIPTNNSISNLAREKHNIDISFELGDTVVLIENKVRSIANAQQLEQYQTRPAKDFSQTATEVKYILLSLKKPVFVQNNKWKHLSYDELLKCFSSLPTSENTYHQRLLEDYSTVMGCIKENIVDKIDFNVISISKLHTGGTDENNALSNFKEVKMGDFFQKGLFEDIANALLGKVKKEEELENAIDSGSLLIDFGMSRAQALLDIKYKYEDDLYIGIQIQGEQYRRHIEGSNEEKVKKAAHCFLESTQWFNFENHQQGITIYPTGQKKFNNYNGKMLYRSIKLGDIRVEDNEALLEIIIKDIVCIKTLLDNAEIKRKCL